MKTTLRYTVRAILAILGITAFLVLIGEPTESLACLEVIISKALSFGTLAGVVKGWMLTLTEEERKELEKERV